MDLSLASKSGDEVTAEGGMPLPQAHTNHHSVCRCPWQLMLIASDVKAQQKSWAARGLAEAARPAAVLLSDLQQLPLGNECWVCLCTQACVHGASRSRGRHSPLWRCPPSRSPVPAPAHLPSSVLSSLRPFSSVFTADVPAFT